MTIRRTLIAIGLIGLTTGPVGLAMAATVMTSLYLASWVPCDNSTDCHLRGALSELMYQSAPANLFNGTREMPFESVEVTSVKLGQAQAFYSTRGNWASSVTFFSDGNVKVYPRIGNDTSWGISGDQADCTGVVKDCPLTTEPLALRF